MNEFSPYVSSSLTSDASDDGDETIQEFKEKDNPIDFKLKMGEQFKD
jgi:hypothetical protein